MLISKGCPWASIKRGAVNLEVAKERLSFVQKGGCSFKVGAQAQRVSAPPLGIRSFGRSHARIMQAARVASVRDIKVDVKV